MDTPFLRHDASITKDQLSRCTYVHTCGLDLSSSLHGEFVVWYTRSSSYLEKPLKLLDCFFVVVVVVVIVVFPGSKLLCHPNQRFYVGYALFSYKRIAHTGK